MILCVKIPPTMNSGECILDRFIRYRIARRSPRNQIRDGEMEERGSTIDFCIAKAIRLNSVGPTSRHGI
jgi:hypothetical protein